MINDDKSQPPIEVESEAEDHQEKHSDTLPSNFTLDNRTKKGVMVAGLIICGMFFPTISTLLLVVSCLLVVSGQASKQVDDFLKTLPFGDHIANTISQIEKFLS